MDRDAGASSGLILLMSDATPDKDRRWMQRAVELAGRALEEGEVPVGAVVVRDGQLIGEGWNRPIAARDASAHAEIQAMRAAGAMLGNYRLGGCTLYVTLEPCAMCAGAMVHARVERLVFGAPDPKTGAAGSVFDIVRAPALNHQLQVESGVMADACGDLLREFFRARR